MRPCYRLCRSGQARALTRRYCWVRRPPCAHGEWSDGFTALRTYFHALGAVVYPEIFHPATVARQNPPTTAAMLAASLFFRAQTHPMRVVSSFKRIKHKNPPAFAICFDPICKIDELTL